ncbi:MAG: 5'(3')-deoxyribonucleotidase [Flavihumibacter sp.]
MERIAIDMDGVLANVYAVFAEWHERETGERKNLSEATGLAEFQAFPNARKYVFTPGFFRQLPPIENGIETVRLLMERYDVFIVSAATEFPQSLGEKIAWLSEHMPFISWQQVVFCGSKKIVQADIMVDDHFKNLDHFEGKTYLFDQPHNHLKPAGRHQRVESWLALRSILLP